MSDLFNNPFIQSAVIPFVVSLIIAVLLRPHGWVWAGFSALLGFAATVYFVSGFDFFPLRSHRKILLLGCGAVAVGVLLDLLPWRKLVPGVLALAAAASAVWLLWPRYSQLEGMELWGLFVGGALYVGWMVVACEGFSRKQVQADAAVFAIALGTGVCALLGASALYGQLVSAIAAAVGARLLMHAVGKPVVAGAVMVVPLVFICAMFGVGAIAFAKLPWYVLFILAAIPLAVRVPVSASAPRLLQLAMAVGLAMVPTAVAIFLTWQKTGAPPI